MKSSEAAQNAAQKTAQNPLYSILAVYIPWSILITGIPLIGRIITHSLPGISFPYMGIFVPILFCSITVSIYAGMMKQLPGDHTAAYVRGVIIITAAAYIIASLLRTDLSLSRRFMPGIANILGALAALYVWIFALYLREIFRAREFFESHTRQYEGENLQRIMLEDSSLMGDADANIRKLIFIYGFQLAIVGILAIVSGILKIQIPLAFLALLVILYVSAACIFAILELFEREQYFAGEGIAVSAPERSKRTAAILFFSLAAAAAALLLAADNNILPISIITGFFAWLAALLSRPAKPQEPASFAFKDLAPESVPRMTLEEQLGLEPQAPWPFWDYVKYALITLLILGFIWFMIKPLLSPGSDKTPFRLKLARLVLQWFKSLRQGIAYFFSALKKDEGSTKMNRPGAAAIRSMSADLLAAYSQAKKRDMKNSLTLFARLILWGAETFHISWKPSRAPGEYCAALVQASPPETGETCAAIIRCGELFEEALYSAEVLSREKQREFKELIEKITK
ncbi:hypothetical protein AGMMS50255_2970 [Spirochaetia bacterium]|nr:hypothetical protein AGMMS50255_2970 [Spirochaetia bacterium]